jgi:hypothetical protein
MKINLSGSSISSRYYLSTSKFSLSKYLFVLGVNDHSIYQSDILQKKNASALSQDLTNIQIPDYLFKLVNQLKIDSVIERLYGSIKN